MRIDLREAQSIDQNDALRECQRLQPFASRANLDTAQCIFEELEEYKPPYPVPRCGSRSAT